MQEIINITKIDDVFSQVDCEDSILYELTDYFSFQAPNYFFHPLYKAGVWDGTIKLFTPYKRKIYNGLIGNIEKFAKARDYKVIVDKKFKRSQDLSPEFIKSFCDSLNMHSLNKETNEYEPITARDYQLYAIWFCLNEKRALPVSPTSSGKSLIIYAILRYLDSIINEQILIIVPTIGLVTQMYNDFAEYSIYDDSWDVEDKIHKIHGGQEKITNKKIVVSTWQSIYKMKAAYFKNFRVLIGDEAHLFQAKSLTTILEKLKVCPYKIGLTGTLGSKTVHHLVLQGLFGESKKIIDTKTLMDRGEVADLSIKAITLKYTDEDKKLVKGYTYQEEIEYLINHEGRHKFLCNLATSLTKTTLILFGRNKHGEKIFDDLTKNSGKNVYFINGGTKIEDREQIRYIAEKEKNCIIVASYGTFSTGVSVKNIHNVIFASPSKSEFRVLQSIGRGLRVSKTKLKVKLFDMVDDLSWKKHKNYALKHFLERMKMYNKEKFEFELLSFKLTK